MVFNISTFNSAKNWQNVCFKTYILTKNVDFFEYICKYVYINIESVKEDKEKQIIKKSIKIYRLFLNYLVLSFIML